MAFQKNDIVDITITDISQDGAGIGHVDGYTLFVKDAVIGDVVRAKVMKAKKSYGFAKLLAVSVPSSKRVAPRCAAADKCGGCQLQALEYGQQLVFKQNKVRNDLIRIGGFKPEDVDGWMHPIVGMEEPWRYRNKAQLPVGTDRNGQSVAGFYAGRTHAIIPVSDCLIGAEGNQKIVDTVLNWMRENRIRAYEETTGKGLVRHILIRSGIYSKQVMVCLVVNAAPGEDLSGSFGSLAQRLSVLPGMTSISLNYNRARTNVIMGDTTQTIWGSGDIEDELHIYDVTYGVPGQDAGAAGGSPSPSFAPASWPAVRFHISPRSFYQVNPRQTEKLYSIVLHYAQLTGREMVWDLYCGVGTISLFLARSAGQVFGVEVVPAAIEDARRNAGLNHITNAAFQVGRVEEVLPDYVHHEMSADSRVDVVVVDPPRKGCDEKCLQTILEVQPRRVVYVSCDPATLARDLKILSAGGYEIQEVQAVDQFPQTVHVETVVCLEWKK